MASKDGEGTIIEPACLTSLLGVLATLPILDEEFPSIDDYPPDDVDLR